MVLLKMLDVWDVVLSPLVISPLCLKGLLCRRLHCEEEEPCRKNIACSMSVADVGMGQPGSVVSQWGM